MNIIRKKVSFFFITYIIVEKGLYFKAYKILSYKNENIFIYILFKR